MPEILFDPKLHPRDLTGRFRSIGSLRNKLLGGARDTQQRWSRWDGRRGYSRYKYDRKKVHDQIVDHFLSQASVPAGVDKPRALLVAGGPGSGKSTVLHGGHVVLPESAVSVDPDAIKEMLPEYTRLRAAGDRNAAKVVHEESSDIAKRLQYTAMQQGFNIVVDGTGNGPPGNFRGKIDRLAKEGYDVDVVVVNSTTETGLKRMRKRFKETGRYVPEQVVKQLHRSVSRRLPEILAANTRSLTIWQNDGDLVKVAEKTPELGFVVYNEDLYDEIFLKGDAPL